MAIGYSAAPTDNRIYNCDLLGIRKRDTSMKKHPNQISYEFRGCESLHSLSVLQLWVVRDWLWVSLV